MALVGVLSTQLLYEQFIRRPPALPPESHFRTVVGSAAGRRLIETQGTVQCLICMTTWLPPRSGSPQRTRSCAETPGSCRRDAEHGEVRAERRFGMVARFVAESENHRAVVSARDRVPRRVRGRRRAALTNARVSAVRRHPLAGSGARPVSGPGQSGADGALQSVLAASPRASSLIA